MKLLPILSLAVVMAIQGNAAVTTISHYRLGENDPGAVAGNSIGTTTDRMGFQNLDQYGSPLYSANVSEAAATRVGSLLSASFNGSNQVLSNGVVITSANNFGIEAWVRPNSTNPGISYIVYNGHNNTNGYGILLATNRYRVMLGGVAILGTGVAQTNTWTHLALVRASGTTTLYVNGIAAGTSGTNPRTPTNSFVIGAQPRSPISGVFNGDIDEVRVFTFGSGMFSTNDLLLNSRVATYAATDLTTMSASLNGGLFPGGLNSSGYFQWGTTTNFGNNTALTNLGSSSSFTNFNAPLSGLNPATTYHYRAVLTNSSGQTFGFNQTFTTPAGPPFAEVPIEGLSPVELSSVAWADYDNDGWMDFLLTGTTNTLTSGLVAQLWRNTGSGFVNVPVPGLAGAVFSAIAWTDFNLDGLPDFIIVGTTNGLAGGVNSALWQNTGSGFTNVTSVVAPGLPRLSQGSVSWSDYDLDGRADLFITGTTNGAASGGLSQLWRNTPAGFTNVPLPGVPGTTLGAVAWADYNGDYRPDFLLTGQSTSGARLSQLWQNTPAGFVNVTAADVPGLPGTISGTVAWNDYNDDGLADFIITGETPARIIQLWHNTGLGFTNVPLPETLGARYGSVHWADYDNDGRSDFLLTGNTMAGFVTELWLNTPSGFVQTNTGMTGVGSLSANPSGVADFNNDGRLDFLLTGTGPSSTKVAELWQSSWPVTNTVSPAPSNLDAEPDGGEVLLSWSAPNDLESGTNLTFNIRIGTAPGASDVVAPLANVTNGFRLVPASGNAGLPTSALVTGLAPGTYYWSVQAIDGALAGSPFAPEHSFAIGAIEPPTLNIQLSGDNVIVSWIPASPGSTLEQSDEILPPNWTPAPTGTNNPAILPADEMRFFRVVLP